MVPGRLWAEVAPQKKRPVYSANAQQLVAGYADPPTGEELRALFETVTYYEQVPTVPRASATKDRHNFQLQRKLEATLNLLVHVAETPEDDHSTTLLQIAGFVRAAYDDVNEARRHEVVGRHQGVLKRKVEEASLLTPAEEEELKKERKAAARSNVGNPYRGFRGFRRGFSSGPWRAGQGNFRSSGGGSRGSAPRGRGLGCGSRHS